MNAEEMWKQSGLSGSYEAWSFGEDADRLADLVKRGIKTATCSAYLFYEMEGDSLPSVGDHSVILNAREEAVCIIETTKVSIVPFKEVPAEHAWKEGEGDRSLACWRRVHEKFFKAELTETDQDFSTKMSIVLEEFQVVYR
jgi:uncharacterized protein YhfF